MKLKAWLLFPACPLLGLATGYLTSFPGKSLELPDEKLVEYALLSQRRATNWSDQKIDLKSRTPSAKDKKKRLNALLAGILRGNTPGDWEKTIKQIVDLASDLEERTDALCLACAQWAETDFDAAMTLARKSGIHAYAIKTTLLDQLATKDPETAKKYYEAHEKELIPYDSFPQTIAENLARQSPEAALAWCLSIKDPNKGKPIRSALNSNKVLDSCLKGILEEHPERLAGFLDKVIKAEDKLPYGFLNYWAKADTENAVKWFESEVAKNESPILMSTLIIGVAKVDFKKAEELIEKHSVKEQKEKHSVEEQDLLYSEIMPILAYSQGEEVAMNWALGKMTPDSNPLFYIAPFNEWSSSDPDSARKWMEKLPAGPFKDEAIDSYSFLTMGRPELTDQALELIDTITDEKRKKDSLKETVKWWQENHPDEFKKWRDDTTKPEHLKAMVNKALAQ